MYYSTFVSTLAMAAAVTAQSRVVKPEGPEKAGPSPDGVVYNATVVPAAKSSTKVDGYFALLSQDGRAVLDFKFNGIAMKNGGPFSYRIFENAVSGNDCGSAGRVFNPYNAEVPLGNVGADPGHQWPISVDTDTNTNGGFPDEFLSLDPKSKNFVGNRALVVSNAKGDLVACGTLKCVKGCAGQDSNNGNSTGTPNGAPTGGPKGNGTVGTNGTVNTPGSPGSPGSPSAPGSPGSPGSGPNASSSGSQLLASAGAMFVAFAAILL